MKRRNETYEYFTDRTVEKNVDFEQLMEEFNKASKERRRKSKSKLKNHRRQEKMKMGSDLVRVLEELKTTLRKSLDLQQQTLDLLKEMKGDKE